MEKLNEQSEEERNEQEKFDGALDSRTDLQAKQKKNKKQDLFTF